MEILKFNQMNETVYYEKLANGLQVYLMPKAGFNKTYATFTTKYGSIDSQFVPLGQTKPYIAPDGVAHFLEHKLFEKEDYDVFEKFTENGAASNAYTSFTRTCYLFSTTSKVSENLTTLLDYVQAPYFTAATVEKEKGIIEEEIKMYRDMADARAYYGMLENLFVNHPMKIDIAGTVESIYQITAEDLHTCYNTFYHPSNMVLFVVGDIEVKQLIELVRTNQAAKGYTDAPAIERIFPNEPTHVATPLKTEYMQISTPKVFIGAKGVVDQSLAAKEQLQISACLDILMEMMFGTSSDYYENLLNTGLANDSFAYESVHDSVASYCFVCSDTNQPEAFSTSVKERLLAIAEMQFDEAEFNRIKRKKIGEQLSMLNSIEFIANAFTGYAFDGLTLFDGFDVLEDLQLTDLLAVAKTYFTEEALSVFQILPEDANRG